MISIHEAKQLIREHCKALPPALLPLAEAAGKTLAETIYAPFDIPAFPQSSMDGYAFCYASFQEQGRLELYGEVAAGNTKPVQLPAGKCVRIFTGAPVPPGADTVVMQEKCSVEADELIIQDPALAPGDNVRLPGSEISKGALALEKGSLLTPAAIGFLAGIGLTRVNVYPVPVISLIVTGNELLSPGEPLTYGQVYESNSLTLRTVLEQAGIPLAELYRVEDQLEALTSTLAHALETSDIVLLTGGISVGDYDFTLKATTNCGAITIFHKIRQKPGKPILFAKKGDKLIFGLPGNPASVLTCYYEYVLEALSVLRQKNMALQVRKVKLDKFVKKPAGITHFLKGNYRGDEVEVLAGQESYKLNSFAIANCLIVLGEEVTKCEAGDLAEIHIIH